jgi:hypothetical protein
MIADFLSRLSAEILPEYKAGMPPRLAAHPGMDGKIECIQEPLENRIAVRIGVRFESKHYLRDTPQKQNLYDEIEKVLEIHRCMLADAIYGEFRSILRLALLALHEGEELKAMNLVGEALQKTMGERP